MKLIDCTGSWSGVFNGTNTGKFVLRLKQIGPVLGGHAFFQEQGLGEYECEVSGKHAPDRVIMRLTPKAGTQVGLGVVDVEGHLVGGDQFAGRWKSSIGTQGSFEMNRIDVSTARTYGDTIFIVHGRDDAAKHEVARFIERLGMRPVVLHEQISRGMTVIEKFEDYAARAGFAVILMTPDDEGNLRGEDGHRALRARQNVVLELGYFVGKLGRSRTFVLRKGEVELPSDVLGVVYQPMDNGDGWKMSLARELRNAGFEVDLNRAL